MVVVNVYRGLISSVVAILFLNSWLVVSFRVLIVHRTGPKRKYFAPACKQQTRSHKEAAGVTGIMYKVGRGFEGCRYGWSVELYLAEILA